MGTEWKYVLIIVVYNIIKTIYNSQLVLFVYAPYNTSCSLSVLL